MYRFGVPIRVVFFDCDGTLTKVRSSWEYLHKRLSLWDGVAEAYERLFREGKIDYSEFCSRDACLWKGLPLDKVLGLIGEIELQEGATDLFHYLKEKGIRTAIISTGLSMLVDRVAAALRTDFSVGNELLCREGRITGEIKINVEYGKKGIWVKKVLEEWALRRDEAAAIGDGRGDEDMFAEVAYPIGFNPEKGLSSKLFSEVRGPSLMPVKEIIEELL